MRMTRLNKIVYSITEVLIPSSPSLGYGMRDSIAKEIAEFNISRINRMVGFLRLSIKIMIYLFDLSSILTIKKLFSSASIPYRIEHIEKIRKIETLPLNDLIKLLRTLSLLAYYDNLSVRKSIGYEQYTPPININNSFE